MLIDNFLIKIWGARGSIPTPGKSTVKFGGNTSCLEIRCGNELIIFDAGTGIRELGLKLIEEKEKIKAHLFFSHLHWDHIQGFPFFLPFYKAENEFDIYAEKKEVGTLQELLSLQMKHPFYPVPLKNMASKIRFNDIGSNCEIPVGDAIITSYRANHPDGCLSYRVDYNGKSIAYSTDTEHKQKMDENIYKAALNADVFIYDCNFTEEEYSKRKGWGHSTWVEGVKIAKEANVKHFIMWHHDSLHNDEFISNLEKEVQKAFPNSQAAFENLTIKLI